MTTLDREKKRGILVVISAVIQGLLLGIYTLTKSGVLLCMPLSIIFIVPFVFWLSQEHWGRRLFNFIAGLTVVLLAFWIYRLWSLYSPDTGFYFVPPQQSELIRISMTVFLLIPFFQCRIAAWSWKFPYSEIFFQFCRNLFLLFQASIVIVVFWGLLVTAGLLFDIVGLNWIPVLIFNPLTSIPLSSLTIAISITVAIKHPGIDSLGRWLLSVLSWLLPFFSVLSVLFLVCLPLSGLQSLWNTGQASTLMILLQSGTIILANTAWLDGSKTPFANKYVNILAQISILCLPVYTALCIYSVGLRIMQYGLTVDRVQAMFMVIITGIWGTGYSLALVMRKWPLWIGRVNVTAIIILAVITTAMNSPVLDPFRLASSNQLSRLQSGKISPEDFDYIYTRFNLGRYGYEVLSELSQSASLRVREGVKSAYSVSAEDYLNSTLTGQPPLKRRNEIITGMKVYPEGMKLTDGQKKYLVSHWNELSARNQSIRRSDELTCVFIDVSTSKDAHTMVIITREAGIIYTLHEDSLVYSGMITGAFSPAGIMRNVIIRTVEPEYKDIVIGDRVYHAISE